MAEAVTGKPEKPTYSKSQVESLKSGLTELASQEKEQYLVKELVVAALPEIKAALQNHSYKYLAEWMSKHHQIEITEGSLKQYVNQANKREAEKNQQSKEQKSSEKASTSSKRKSGGNGSKGGDKGEENSKGERGKPETSETLPQNNSSRKPDYK